MDMGKEQKVERLILLALVIGAVLIRVLYAIPGMLNPELVMRPDSATYLGPAYSLLYDGTYSTGPGSRIPALVRTPGYPFFLACLLLISGKSLGFCILASSFASAFTVVPVFLSARLFASRKASVFATVLLAINPTSLALAPMFVSDSLFALFLAWEVFLFLKFIVTKRMAFFFGAVVIGGFATLIRPLNLFWIFPCIFVFCCIKGFSWQCKLRASSAALCLFLCILVPWFVRNKVHGAGWRIDAVSADTALHNRSALESRLTGVPGAELRENYRRAGEAEFKRHPELYAEESARLSYYEGKLMEIIKEHPFRYFALHVRPITLIPDAASFLENLGITRTGRNTWDIINRNGVLAGIRHYFDGNYLLPCLLAPLLLAALLLYVLAFWNLLETLWKRDWLMLMLFLLLSEYYLFITSPVAMPRYQLAALPFFCVMAACAQDSLCKKINFSGVDNSSLS